MSRRYQVADHCQWNAPRGTRPCGVYVVVDTEEQRVVSRHEALLSEAKVEAGRLNREDDRRLRAAEAMEV